MVIERDMDKLPNHLLNLRACFDEFEVLLFCPTLFGIVVYNLLKAEPIHIIGKEERNERFVGLHLFQGRAMSDTSGQTGKGGTSSQQKEFDPCIFATSHKKPRYASVTQRFFIFSKRKPVELQNKVVSRDVFNEKPLKEDLISLDASKASKFASKIILCTSMGDIFIRIFPEEVPKTAENFLAHCKNGYYNSLIFHRVIKGFMVQTGCPNGDGTGGTPSSPRRVHLGRRVRRRVPPLAQTRQSLHRQHGQPRTEHQRLAVLHHHCPDHLVAAANQAGQQAHGLRPSLQRHRSRPGHRERQDRLARAAAHGC